MTDRIWILGASDPEMEQIERLLRQCGEEIIYATGEDGRRVHPGNAYLCPVPAVPEGATVYAVECIDALPEGWVRIDHHRPGDPGYGRPPAEFMAASPIGQVISRLGSLGWLPADWPVGDGQYYSAGGCLRLDPEGWAVDDEAGGAPRLIPQRYIYAAAADHCPVAAYRGECPGVDPDALMRWRVESRAAHQGRPSSDILTDIERARVALREAPRIDLGAGPVCDMREAYTVQTVLVVPFVDGATVDSAGVGDSTFVVFGPRAEGAWDEGGHHTFVERGVAELPEAAAREGVAYLATVTDRDGRHKVVLGGHTTPEMVKAFVEEWAPSQGLVDIYGEPARGFAGGYLAARPSALA